ncbi:hypothetical protein RHSIM_Rhsim09G0101000 [Rhododendron simsii]|uniref:Uncharacterized protein n=1 Tax=Rhododendron simsii TaxID=118357 RepID=A0A834LEB7_RHOSS|nr:hypothetical protein RHSIM_Rhsim09G0101000 [Rhododendron simsii]
MKIFFVSQFFLFLSVSFFSSILAAKATDSVKFILGEESLGPLKHGALSWAAQAPGPANEVPSSTLVLAASRTKRPDILHGFRRYRGGWDFANKHYWAVSKFALLLLWDSVSVLLIVMIKMESCFGETGWGCFKNLNSALRSLAVVYFRSSPSVGFTGAFGFILAVLWFVSFGLALVVHHCCGWRIKVKGKESHLSQRICLILLLVFTCAAATGCILLSVGQDGFHGESMHTLKYVVNQSDFTVQTLRNVTEYLLLAKSINVAQVFLPSDVKVEIDKLNEDLNTAADMLSQKTSQNSGKIQRTIVIDHCCCVDASSLSGWSLYVSFQDPIDHLWFYPFLVTNMQFTCKISLGSKFYHIPIILLIFVISGWLLVAVTFVLCGGFVILNNAISDTCMAMGEWVDNSHAETALSNILPCVDQRTTNQTLTQSKQVVNDIVNIVNQFIYTIADTNPSPQANYPSYYNQSGPSMPPLCYPYDSQLQVRQCTSFEVSMENASLVWQNFTCTVSASGLCTSVGRVTPDMYGQLVAAVNISVALQRYAPPLLSLQDCNFVRDTFRNITSNYCPPLEHDLQTVNAGLALISVGVMLCLALWLLYANRPQREEVFAKLSFKIKNTCRNINSNADVLSTSTTPRSGA